VRLIVLAVGRLKAGPERELFDRYAERISAAGKAVGITMTVREFAEGRAGSETVRIAGESRELAGAIPGGARTVALDSRGKTLTSEAFAQRLARWRDDGVADVAFVIGGPDGFGPPVRDRADVTLAFGAATWPHQLARIMLAEQLYRAVTILAGHPYHRA
jgi:23S rRNA (pseudouridine1915-N3)-methyltransferase